MKPSKYNNVCAQINDYAELYHRDPGLIRLIAVSKTRTTDEILTLFKAGQRAFGENYLQEALSKIQALNTLEIDWHFIGAIQSRKAQLIAHNFHWVHSLDRLKVATKLNQYREDRQPLNVLIQVNVEGESSKGGIAPDDMMAMAMQIIDMPNLCLRGLMFMPKIHQNFEDQCKVYAEAQNMFINLQAKHAQIDHLSMGMSADMQAAIAKGATMLRIGTALFGPRS